MPAFAQQTMMMTYELQVVCENLPGSSVTITAEAQGDLYGPTGTLLDPDDPANHPFFSNEVYSPLNNGTNTEDLIWDFLDDNSGAERLMRGLYKFTGPNDSYFYINYLHCHSGSPDIKIRLSYTGGTYKYHWKNNLGQWEDITADNLNLWHVTNETRDVSCLEVDILLQNVFHLRGGGSINTIGEIYVDDIHTSYQSPSTVPFELWSEHDSWPSLNLTDAVETGEVHRFRHWNENDALHDIVYNWTANVDGEASAHHYWTYGSIARVRIDGINSSGSIFLRDPWKVVRPQNDIPYNDYDFNQISIPVGGFDFGDINLFGGVFQDAPPSQGKPYYTFRTAEQAEWYGSGWIFKSPTTTPDPVDSRFVKFNSGTGELDIYFTDPVNQNHVINDYVTRDAEFNTDNTQILVDYKAHLASSTPVSYSESRGTLGANSQRQIGYLRNPVSGNDSFVAVYESNDHIWLVRRVSGTGDWSWELELGPGNRPSLYTVDDSAFVTWVQNGSIAIGKYHDGQFQHFESAGMIARQPADDAFPVIAHAVDITCVVFESRTVNTLSYVVIQCDDLLFEGVIPDYFSGSTACLTPSMTASYGPDFDIAWREDRDIVTTQLVVRTWLNPVDVQIDPPQLLPRYNENYVGAPSITNYHSTGTPPNNIYKIIAAPSRTLGEAKINIFCLDATWQWSAMQSFFSSFTSHDIWAPSVSSIDRTPCSSDFDNVRCAFNVTDHTVYPTAYRTRAVDVACGAWTLTDPQVDEAIHPSIVAFPPADRGRGVHIDLLSTAVPQALAGDLRQIGNTDVALNKTTARSRLRGARMLWLTVDTTHAGVGIGKLSLNARGVSDPLAWHAKPATTPISGAAAAAAHIRSEAFVPTSQTELSLQTLQERIGNHTIPAYSMLSLELLDASTDMVVEVLASIDAATMQTGRSLATLTKDLSSYSGRNVFVRLRPTASATQASIAVAEYYNLDPSSSGAFPKTAAEGITPEVTAAPSEIRLEQNYPNPFNPTTTLALYLPQSSYARLVVHDQMGRIVATLLDAETDAGYHTLSFDATHLPSGVYYAKLTVRDMTVTRSMTLLR